MYNNVYHYINMKYIKMLEPIIASNDRLLKFKILSPKWEQSCTTMPIVVL